jgi:hypothetical protein
MSLKLHFLQSNLDFFRGNTEAVSDQHGERSHQDISRMEIRYSGKWNTFILDDYYWTIVRETPIEECKKTKDDKISFYGTFIYFY